jgi:hypothetical protein
MAIAEGVEVPVKLKTNKNSMNEVADTFSKRIEDNTKKLVKNLGLDKFKATADVTKTDSGGNSIAMGVAAGLAAGGMIALLEMIADAVKGMPVITAIMKVFGVVIGALLLPLIPILKPLLLLLAVMARLLVKWLLAKTSVEKVGAVVGLVAGIIAAIAAGVPALMVGLIAIIGAALGLLAAKFGEWLRSVLPPEAIAKFFVDLFNNVWGWIQKALSWLANIGKWIWEQILKPAFSFLSDVGVKIWDFIMAGLTAIGNLGDKIWGVIKGLFSGSIDVLTSVWGFIKGLFAGTVDVVTSVWKWIKGLFTGTINVATTVWNWFKGLFKSKTGNSDGSVDDGIISNGRIITTNPSDYIVATKNPMSLGGGQTVNININNPTVSNQQDIRVLVQAISQELSKQQRRYNSYV